MQTKTHRKPMIAVEIDLEETYQPKHVDPYGPKVVPLRDDLLDATNHQRFHHPMCDCQQRVRAGIPVPRMTVIAD